MLTPAKEELVPVIYWLDNGRSGYGVSFVGKSGIYYSSSSAPTLSSFSGLSDLLAENSIPGKPGLFYDIGSLGQFLSGYISSAGISRVLVADYPPHLAQQRDYAPSVEIVEKHYRSGQDIFIRSEIEILSGGKKITGVSSRGLSASEMSELQKYVGYEALEEYDPGFPEAQPGNAIIYDGGAYH